MGPRPSLAIIGESDGLAMPKRLCGRRELVRNQVCAIRSDASLACAPQFWQLAWLGNPSFIREPRRAFLDEGSHPFLAIFGREQGMKNAPLEAHALGE
jgi:hypothetical protein